MKPYGKFGVLAVLLAVSAATLGWAATMRQGGSTAASVHGAELIQQIQQPPAARPVVAPPDEPMARARAVFPGLPGPSGWMTGAWSSTGEPAVNGCPGNPSNGGAVCFSSAAPAQPDAVVFRSSFTSLASAVTGAEGLARAMGQGDDRMSDGLLPGMLQYGLTRPDPGASTPATPATPTTPGSPATPGTSTAPGTAPPTPTPTPTPTFPTFPTAGPSPISPVPEPETWTMLAGGLATIAFLARRRAASTPPERKKP
jgi:hypothetical protein